MKNESDNIENELDDFDKFLKEMKNVDIYSSDAELYISPLKNDGYNIKMIGKEENVLFLFVHLVKDIILEKGIDEEKIKMALMLGIISANTRHEEDK